MFAPEKSLVSPRISRVAEAVAAGNHGAVDELWKEVAEKGSPLREQVADDPSKTLVTFLWRDPGDTENVLVFFYSVPEGSDPRDFGMRRIPATDVWYASYFLPSHLRTTYLYSVNDSLRPFTSYADVVSRIPSYGPDPLNPVEHTILGQEGGMRVSVLELPDAPKQPWNIKRRGVPKGSTRMQTIESEILGTQHHVSVYTPPGYDTSGETYHVFVLFDGWAYYNFADITTVLDNLVYVGRIPPYVLVMHSNVDQRTRALELPCHRPFVDFLNRELMPWVHENYHITDDPARTVVGGSCFGGLAAAYAALTSPERFGNVISQSGSFWWPEKDHSELEPEWLTRQFERHPRLPVRFSLEIGSLEEAIVDYDPMTAHLNFHDVLRAKGYEVDYSEYMGGHDLICWRGSMVDRLLSFHPKQKETAR
ncbi:enterochelin esterase [Streptomyces reniochalinae]|uniref:Enterochelin esterase n=1 Tax=Streptomyces reniochalinae TaxID=2250578 RepID=A0A367EJV3_9ACTN|nr:enterochelin esterase [Streptomyces reniochalinae]RCG17647.1 enterochelin esterase [Streptomyces reniochalinae]